MTLATIVTALASTNSRLKFFTKSSIYCLRFEQFLNIDNSVISKLRKSWIGEVLNLYIKDHQSAISSCLLFFILGKYQHIFFDDDAVTANIEGQIFRSNE